jgi:mono/diheme cytochrome c family protein
MPSTRFFGFSIQTLRISGLSLLAFLLFLPRASNSRPRPGPDNNQLPPDFVTSGKQTFLQYCAACHGSDAKGYGPARRALKIPAADLTTLARRHGGEFPYDYVTGVLKFGPGFAAHGASDMPTWGPIFQSQDNYNQAIVQKRIKNLCDYLASLQIK